MLNWLVQDFGFLGLTGQYWMPVLAGALALYTVIIMLVRRGAR